MGPECLLFNLKFDFVCLHVYIYVCVCIGTQKSTHMYAYTNVREKETEQVVLCVQTPAVKRECNVTYCGDPGTYNT